MKLKASRKIDSDHVLARRKVEQSAQSNFSPSIYFEMIKQIFNKKIKKILGLSTARFKLIIGLRAYFVLH